MATWMHRQLAASLHSVTCSWSCLLVFRALFILGTVRPFKWWFGPQFANLPLVSWKIWDLLIRTDRENRWSLPQPISWKGVNVQSPYTIFGWFRTIETTMKIMKPCKAFQTHWLDGLFLICLRPWIGELNLRPAYTSSARAGGLKLTVFIKLAHLPISRKVVASWEMVKSGPISMWSSKGMARYEWYLKHRCCRSPSTISHFELDGRPRWLNNLRAKSASIQVEQLPRWLRKRGPFDVMASKHSFDWLSLLPSSWIQIFWKIGGNLQVKQHPTKSHVVVSISLASEAKRVRPAPLSGQFIIDEWQSRLFATPFWTLTCSWWTWGCHTMYGAARHFWDDAFKSQRLGFAPKSWH